MTMAAQNCQSCGKPLPPGSAFCTGCGARVPPPVSVTPVAQPIPASQPSPQPQPVPTGQVPPGVRPRTCVNCKTQMAAMGQVAFRTGPTPGGAGMVLGGWNPTPDASQPFSMYYCQQCGKFDLYYAGT
jgi:Double zinc ribbon